MTRPVNRPNPLLQPPAPRLASPVRPLPAVQPPRPVVAQPFRPQPRQSPGVPPPAAIAPRVSTVPRPNRLQPSLARPVQPATVVHPARPSHPPRPVAPPPLHRPQTVQPRQQVAPAAPPPRPNGRPPVIQRTKGQPPTTPTRLHKATRTYRSWRGERVLLIDNGRNRISVFATVGGQSREIAYLTYELEVEDGVKIFAFGYIQAQPSAQGKKLSSLLLYHLALKALSANVPIIRVVKPDPGLAYYWQHVGFDFGEAKRKQARQYGVDASEIRVVPEAEGTAGAVLRLNQRIAGTYWDLSAPDTTSHEEDWYKERKAVLVGHNMYEGSVKPLRDYSSSYIS